MKLIYYYKNNGLFWIRIFGKGFYVKNSEKRTLLFSERNGINIIRIGKYIIGFLRS